jgi:hypothetical protein
MLHPNWIWQASFLEVRRCCIEKLTVQGMSPGCMEATINEVMQSPIWNEENVIVGKVVEKLMAIMQKANLEVPELLRVVTPAMQAS